MRTWIGGPSLLMTGEGCSRPECFGEDVVEQLDELLGSDSALAPSRGLRMYREIGLELVKRVFEAFRVIVMAKRSGSVIQSLLRS